MLHLNDQNGEIQIDFPDAPTVTIKPLKFGAYRRIRAEQNRIATENQAKQEALPPLDEMPPNDDTSPEATTKRARVIFSAQMRLSEAQDLLAESLVAIWKFILLGNEQFQGCAMPRPSEDPDEWPMEMLVDRTMLDAVMEHLGKVRRSPSGPSPQ